MWVVFISVMELVCCYTEKNGGGGAACVRGSVQTGSVRDRQRAVTGCVREGQRAVTAVVCVQHGEQQRGGAAPLQARQVPAAPA